MQPLRSSPITGPSSLLRAAPPLCSASVLSSSRFWPLETSQPPLVAQLGDGAQQGVAEHSLQPAGSPADCQLTSTHQTARCGPACRVVWQGAWGHDLHAPMPIVDAMNLLSIQSHVAYGHVGNAAAVFPLQRMGVEVWPLHTVQFSYHTGYGNWQGRVFDAGMIRELVAGIAQRGVLGTCDGVLSGYMGGADIGSAILDCVASVKRANPAARYACDPVIGDVGRGVFV